MFYAGAFAITNRLGVKIDKVTWRKEPIWKRRLQNNIKELRKDLSQLEASKYKGISNFRHWERLERKSSIRVKRLNVAIEELIIKTIIIIIIIIIITSTRPGNTRLMSSGGGSHLMVRGILFSLGCQSY